MRWRHRTCVVCLALLVLLVLACGSQEERTEQAREDVREALQQGERGAALDALEELREVGPDTSEALIELTSLMVQAGEAADAVWLLEDALPRHPGRDDLRLQLARLAMQVQDPSRVRRVLEPIVAGSDQHLEALLLRSRAELELGDLESALAALDQAAALYPDRPEARLVRVQALMQERKREEARAAVDEALASLEFEEDARRRFALLAASLDAQAGETDAAVERLRALVEAGPDDAQAWQVLVQTLLRARRGAEAEAALTAALEENAENPLLHGLLADVYATQGKAAEAEAGLRRMVELNDTPSTRLALDRFHAQRGEIARAEEMLEEAVAKHPESALLRLRLAERRIDAGDLDGAREAADAFRGMRPHDPHVEYLTARIELASGDSVAAARRLKTVASRLDTSYIQFWLGSALEESGDLPGAQRRYALALQRDRRDPAAAAALVRVATARGDWRETAAAARQLAARAPQMLEAWEVLAEALLRLDEPKPAEAVARSLTQRAPERIQPIRLLASALLEQGRYAEAQQVLDEAIARLGPRPELEADRALGLAVQGRVEEAIVALDALAASHPDSGDVQRTHAMLLFGRGDAQAGAQATDRALALEPENPAPLATRARFRASRGMWEDARADARRYLDARPDDAEMWFVLGAVEAGAGDRAAAAQAYRRAAALDERHFAARNNLALILAESGNLDAAVAAAQEAHALEPDNADGLDTLGWLYLQRGLVERSIAFLERARDASPADEEPRLHLALAYREAGRGSEARPLLEALTRDEKTSPETARRAKEALATPVP